MMLGVVGVVEIVYKVVNQSTNESWFTPFYHIVTLFRMEGSVYSAGLLLITSAIFLTLFLTTIAKLVDMMLN